MLQHVPPIISRGEVDFVDELGPGASTVQKGRILAMGGCGEAQRVKKCIKIEGGKIKSTELWHRCLSVSGCRKCMCGGGGRVLTEVRDLSTFSS